MKCILLFACLIMGHQSRGNMEFQCETIDGEDGYEYLKWTSQTSIDQEYDASILRRLAKCQLDRRHNEADAGLSNLKKASAMGDILASLILGDMYRVGGTNISPFPMNHPESIKWYEDVLRKINQIPDYPNTELTSLIDNEIDFKTYPYTLLQLTHLYTTQYYLHGFSGYKESPPSGRNASELQQTVRNNQRLLEEVEGPLNRCLTDIRALTFEERARNLGVKEPYLIKYHKYQEMVREELCPLYRTLVDRAYQMEEAIYNQVSECAAAGSRSAAACRAMDQEVEGFNQAATTMWNQYNQIHDACNCF